MTLRLVKGSRISKVGCSSTKNSSRTRVPRPLFLLPPFALKAVKVHRLNRGTAEEVERIVDRVLDRLEGRST